MESQEAVEIAYELIESEYTLLGQHGYLAMELQDGTILAAKYQQETRLAGTDELEAAFDFIPLWGSHPDGIRKRAEELGIGDGEEM